ncbi:MAG TPA: ferrochelatase [Oleiagrimonas sp.]|nr:ferrochelatase [Oleiagrimonas sp.]
MLGTRQYTGLDNHTRASLPTTGVLLVNLGTPDAPTAAALRPYLAEFLSDPRVIEYPRWLWWLILHGVILRTRPARSARAYEHVWMPEGSPLRVYSEALTDAVRAKLEQRGRPFKVALAMRYGHPRIADTIADLQRQGVGRLQVLPLYPQYSATSTGSVVDAVADALKTLRWTPETTLLGDYHDDDGYLDALANSVREHWSAHGRGERLVMSFHGIPQRYARAGDPYALQCEATAQKLRERLGLDETEAPISFQSRVGREPWLTPATDATVRKLGATGIKRIDVICPGFAVDCLETLEEIAMQNRDFFRTAGGEELRYIAALNATDGHVQALCDLIERRLPLPA